MEIMSAKPSDESKAEKEIVSEQLDAKKKNITPDSSSIDDKNSINDSQNDKVDNITEEKERNNKNQSQNEEITPSENNNENELDGQPKTALDSENDDEDDDDDGIQVTIGDIRNQAFEPQKFKAPYQRQGSQNQNASQGGSASKPNLKGIDFETVGTINGVPIFDYDLDSVKLEDKPWRKPGADITDYFNYGFTEETWTKYCEKQKRLRLDNNCKVGLILGNGDVSDEISKEDADIYLGQPTRRSSGLGVSHRIGSKPQGIIDVIGSSLRDSRRPLQANQKIDLTPDVVAANSVSMPQMPSMMQGHMHIQQSPGSQISASGQTSTAAVLPISINMPPPPLNIPPPDFALPPPTALPHQMPPPHHNVLGNQQILMAQPNPYGVPTLPGQFDGYYRPPMMPGVIPSNPNQPKDRRGMTGAPFRFDNPYSAPPPFQPPPGMPPTWGPVMQNVPPPQVSSRSPKKNKNGSDISSSEEESRSRENSDRQYSESRYQSSGGGRTSRDRSRVRDYDRSRERSRRDYDSRSRHYHSSRHYSYRDSSRSHRKRDRSSRDNSYDRDRKKRSSSSSDSESDYEDSRSKK